jgi:hypothetical protein
MINIFIRRRILIESLDKLVYDFKSLSHIEDPKIYLTSVYDLVRTFIFSNNEMAKEISRQSDLNINWYGFYNEIQDNILNYLRNIINEENKSI